MQSYWCDACNEMHEGEPNHTESVHGGAEVLISCGDHLTTRSEQ